MRRLRVTPTGQCFRCAVWTTWLPTVLGRVREKHGEL